MDNARSLGARRSYLRQVQGTGVGFDVRAVSSLCPRRFGDRFEIKSPFFAAPGVVTYVKSEEWQ